MLCYMQYYAATLPVFKKKNALFVSSLWQVEPQSLFKLRGGLSFTQFAPSAVSRRKTRGFTTAGTRKSFL